MFVQRMFCNDKKNDTFGDSLATRVGEKIPFYFFSVLIVIVDACRSRWRDASFFLELED